MDEQKTPIVEKLKQATNILVTVSSSPSVDQLSAAIGLTVFLNKIGKHASAVFSGKIPSAIQFLEPQKTLEKNTDSLRDFIIALDKAKADKLRYKVEDEMVKIFITPYQTSITDKDLEFSHGDFNVEVVMALGVKEQSELDQAITAHGSILHDAAVFGVGAGDPPVALGNTNWNDPKASSLSEMIASLCVAIQPDALDAQMATALMTGIVAETERFSNEKTSSETMQVSSKLMQAGANQQLVASQLQKPSAPAAVEVTDNAELPEPQDTPDATPGEDKPSSDGSLHITHGDISSADDAPSEPEGPSVEQIHIDEDGTIKNKQEDKAPKPTHEKVLQPPSKDTSSRLMLEPPSTGEAPLGVVDESSESDTALSGARPEVPLLSHDEPKADEKSDETESTDPEDTVIIKPTAQLPKLDSKEPLVPLPVPQPTPAPEPTKPKVMEPPTPAPAPLDSLANLEKKVDSPHVEPTPDLNAARDAVNQAMGVPAAPSVVQPTPPTPPTPPLVPLPPTEQNDPGLPPGFTSLIEPSQPAGPSITNPAAPPTVPPPMTPPPMMPPPPMPPTNPPTPGTPGQVAL